MSFKKILVMDEEYWSIQPAIDRIESMFGSEIIEYCTNGADGLLQLEKNKFDCVILDIMFPLGNDIEEDDDEAKKKSINGGITILNEIRNNLKLKIPVICFTFRDDDEVKSDIRSFQNTSHVSKINQNALELLITQLKKHLN